MLGRYCQVRVGIVIICLVHLLLSFNRFIKYTSNDKRRSIHSAIFAKRRVQDDKIDKTKTASSADSWKVLTTKLSSSKSAKQNFGKLEKKIVVDNTVDELQCVHFKTCSGCSIRGNFTDATPVVGRAKRFFISKNIVPTIHLGNITEWRTLVKLAVQPMSKWGGLKFGLYKSGTHEVEPISNCRVHHPAVNIAIEELKKHAIEAGVRGYEEANNGLKATGDLRYIQMSVERETGKVQLTLVWNAMMYKDCSQALPRLVKRLKSRPDIWHSIYMNFQQSDGNAIFNYAPNSWKVLWGPPLLREKIGDATFFFQPQIFRQANLDAFERGIIPKVLENIPLGSTVAELYSGLGTIGLNAAKGAALVFCSDSNEYVESVFDSCVDSLPRGDQDKLFFEAYDAETAVAEGQCEDATIVIVDPPRKGLDQGVIDLLIDADEDCRAERLERLIYVSCGFDALERDTNALLKSGLWKVRSADGYLLFPGSDHIETVVVFDKLNPNDIN